MTYGRTVSGLTMPCPECGHDATWNGSEAGSGGGTYYSSVHCPHCEGWTVRAQIRRAMTRRTA